MIRLEASYLAGLNDKWKKGNFAVILVIFKVVLVFLVSTLNWYETIFFA